jgi:hypothetical protein
MAVSKPQVVVVNPTAARQQVKRKLHRLHVLVAPCVLEVRLALPSRLLEALDTRLAFKLILHQGRGD